MGLIEVFFFRKFARSNVIVFPVVVVLGLITPSLTEQPSPPIIFEGYSRTTRVTYIWCFNLKLIIMTRSYINSIMRKRMAILGSKDKTEIAQDHGYWMGFIAATTPNGKHPGILTRIKRIFYLLVPIEMNTRLSPEKTFFLLG